MFEDEIQIKQVPENSVCNKKEEKEHGKERWFSHSTALRQYQL